MTQLRTFVEQHAAKGLFVFGVVVIMLGGSVWWQALANDDPVFLDPQGSIRADLARSWIDTGAPRIELDDRALVPEDVQIALLPRDASIVDWAVVPKDFAYPVILNTLLTPLGPAALGALTPLAALASALVAARILWALTGSSITAASGFVVLSSSVIWWSASYGGASFTLVGVTFGLLMVYFLVKEHHAGGDRDVTWYLVLAGVFAGIASGFHYTSTPWWAAVLVVGCIGRWTTVRSIGQRLLVGAAGAFVGLSPVLVFNQAVYGNPTATGYSEFATVLDAIGWSAPALGFSSAAFGANLRTYLVRPELIPVILLAALSLPALRSLGIRVRPIHGAVLAAGYLVIVSVTGSATLWGTNSFETNASFLRYNAPIFGLVVVLALLTLHRLGAEDRRFVLVPALFALTFAAVNIATIVPGRSGWIDSRAGVTRTVDERDLMRDVIPDDAIVITRRGDKLLFGERTTLVAAYLRTFTDARGTEVHLYDTFPDITRLANVVIRLQPQPVVVLNDSRWISDVQLDRFERLLGDEDLCLDAFDDLIMTVTSCSPDADSA